MENLKSMNIIFLVFLIILQMDCKKNEIITPTPPPPEEVVEKLQIIWQRPILENNSILSISGPVIHNEKIIIGRPESIGEALLFLDKKTGDLLFRWDDRLKRGLFSNSKPLQIIEGNVFASSRTQGYLVNTNTGQTTWVSKEIEYGEPRTNVTLKGIYHGTLQSNRLNNEFSYLTKLNLEDGSRDTIYTIKRINSYEPSIEPPAGWVNSNGDTILIWLSRLLDFGGTLDEQLDTYAYNVTSDSIEWKLIDFDPEGSSRIGPPLIEDDLVFFAGERTFYCLNAVDGSLVWKRRFEDDMGAFTEDLFSSVFIKVGDKLIISPSNRNTYCFDAFTGEEIWKETDSASSPKNMLHHNEIIYCTSRGRGKLFAFDVNTGEHFWRESSPNFEKDDRAIFDTNIAIDPELGYLYASDRFFIMAIKLIER